MDGWLRCPSERERYRVVPGVAKGGLSVGGNREGRKEFFNCLQYLFCFPTSF